MTAKEIIQKMVDEMPFDIERRVIPYIEEAMTIYAEAKAKEAFEAACQLQINNCLDYLRPNFSDSLAYGDVASAIHPDYETYKQSIANPQKDIEYLKNQVKDFKPANSFRKDLGL